MARILGIDITNTSIRAVMVRTGFRKVEVARYLAVPLARFANQEVAAVEVSEAIRGVWRALGQAPDLIVTDMPGDRVSLRTLQLPITASKHIGQVLPFELDSLLPFSAEAAIIDYQTVAVTRDEIKLLVAAAVRKQVESRLSELRQYGIEPHILTAGAATLEGLAPLAAELRQEAPIMVADIGFNHADLCILRAGRCEAARTLSVGAGSPPHKPPEELWRGIQRTIAAYRTAGGEPLRCIYVAGEGVSTGIYGWLTEALQLPAGLLPLPSTPDVDPNSLPLFARAAAMAGHGAISGRKIDLRQGEFARPRAAGVLWRHAKLLGACAVAILLSLCFSVYAQRSVLLEEQKALRAGLKEITKEVFGKAADDVGEVEKMLSRGATDDPLPRFDAFDALETVSNAVPPEVTHDVSRLTVEVGDYNRDGRFELRGTLGSIEQRDALTAQLEKNECFKEIKKGRTSPGREPNRINYQIEASLQCPVGEAPAKAQTVRRSDE